MQATMERTTVDPEHGMLPSVTYDQAHSRIVATLVVSLPAGSEELSILFPIIAFPATASPWTLVWRIQADTATLEWAHFDTDTGIQLPGSNGSTPLGVEVETLGLGPTESEWQVKITNQTHSTSRFNYDISVYANPIFVDLKNPIVKTINDPTIVVTPEPMG